MQSRKGYWLAVFALFAIVAGIWARSGGLIAAAVPVLAYITLTGLLTRNQEFELELERTLDETRIMAGDSLLVELRIRNLGETLDVLEVEDVLPEFTYVSDGGNRAILHLDKGEEFTLRYSLACPYRGKYIFERTRLRYQDHTGFILKRINFRLRSQFSVVSEIEPARGLKIAPRKTRNWIGMIKSRRIGAGSEFFGMREYVSGDSLRKINWKASARSTRLITNEYESEQSGDVTILLDARRESNVGTLDDNTVEHGIRATSTIASHILKEKNRVGLIVLRDIIDEVYPAFGKRQFYRISEVLMSVRAGGELPFEDARWMVTSHFPLESQIIVVSSLMDYKIVGSIADLCARGYDVVVVSPSPMDVEGRVLEQDRELAIAKRILALERKNLISDLQKYARIVDWQTDEPIASAMKGVERLQARY